MVASILIYLPDLTPCDYFLFPNIKKCLGGKRLRQTRKSSGRESAARKSVVACRSQKMLLFLGLSVIRVVFFRSSEGEMELKNEGEGAGKGHRRRHRRWHMHKH